MELNVKNLLSGKIDKKFDDKVFWYASKVLLTENRVSIYIYNDNLVTFDNIIIFNSKKKLQWLSQHIDLSLKDFQYQYSEYIVPVKKLSNLKKISEFRNAKQKSKNILENILISSGSFLFINDKLVVTQRDSNTSFDPGFWTTPAGRCDRSILETGIKETIEEIEIKKNSQLYYPDVSQSLSLNKENIIFYKTSFSNKNYSLKTFDINLYLDNVLISECKSWMYFSQEVNTIEFRIPIFATLDTKDLSFSNPEFETATGLKSLNELRELNTVPALKKLLEEIENA